jgi:hypothetical protein
LTPDAPGQVVALAELRSQARVEKDFTRADALRDEIRELGWEVVDGPNGFSLEPLVAQVRRLHPSKVESVLKAQPVAGFSVQWVVQGWPEDVVRSWRSFHEHRGEHDVQYVVVDAVGSHPSFYPSEVEEVWLEDDFGWGVDRNAGLRRAAGDIVVVVDGSLEVTGDVLTPIAEALSDGSVGVVGPFGIVTDNMREFHDSPGPEVDAVEGYLMAFRRELLDEVGFFDEKFRFYRSADIEFSFRIKEAGYRALVVPMPVERHEHRMWHNTPEAERERLSKRNFYRFLERFRDRMDLTVAGASGREPDS